MPSAIRCRAAVSSLFAGILLLGASPALALLPGFTSLTLWSPRRIPNEFFGRSVASLGSKLVVGAPGSSSPMFGALPGRVYVLGLDYQGGRSVAALGSDVLVMCGGVASTAAQEPSCSTSRRRDVSATAG